MCRMKSYGKTLVCLAAAALLACLFSGCSSLRKVKDIKVTSCGLESYSMQGLRSLSAVLALGIDNPAMSFTVTSLDGVIKYNGEDFATYTTTGQVEVDGRCVKVYDVPCTATLRDGVRMATLLSIIRKGSMEGFTTDLSAKVRLRNGMGKTLRFRGLDIQEMMNKDSGPK